MIDLLCDLRQDCTAVIVSMFTIIHACNDCHLVILSGTWHCFQVLLKTRVWQVITKSDDQPQWRVAAQPRDDAKASAKDTGMMYAGCKTNGKPGLEHFEPDDMLGVVCLQSGCSIEECQGKHLPDAMLPALAHQHGQQSQRPLRSP